MSIAAASDGFNNDLISHQSSAVFWNRSLDDAIRKLTAD